MKKKVNFYISNPEVLCISKETNRFGFRTYIIGRESYTLEEIQLIRDKLLKEGLQIDLEIENKSTQPKTEYIRCGECKCFLENYGCISEISKVKNKVSKTKLSKGCFWGEKYE